MKDSCPFFMVKYPDFEGMLGILSQMLETVA
jgi:hypothetical protein